MTMAINKLDSIAHLVLKDAQPVSDQVDEEENTAWEPIALFDELPKETAQNFSDINSLLKKHGLPPKNKVS